MKETVRPDHKENLSEGAKRSPKQSHVGFSDILIDSVDEVITEVLGQKVSSMFSRHYQGLIPRDEMPHQLPRLFVSLQTIFGTSGGETLGERVIERLYAKANIPLNYSRGRPLAEYAQELKETLAKKSRGS